MSEDYSEEVKELVKIRLKSTPSNVRISIGSFGEFDRDQLINEIDKNSEIGKATIELELLFLRKMATISKRIVENR